MRRELFYLHSALPPAELKDGLEQEVRIQNRLHYKKREIILKWKDGYAFTFHKVDHYRSSGPYRNVRVEPGGTSVSFSTGRSWWNIYSPVFCGRLAPDGEGSVICVYFRQLLAAWLMCIAIFGIGAVWFMAAKQFLSCLFVLGLGVPFFRALLTTERTPPSGELWDLLEQMI